MRALAISAILCCLTACSSEAVDDASVTDTSVAVDRGVAVDLGFADALVDLGVADTGVADEDAGFEDAPAADAPAADAPAEDAFTEDAGFFEDALPPDSGAACDSMPCLPGSTCTELPQGYSCTPCMGAQCPMLRALAGADQDVIAGSMVTLQGSADGANGAISCIWTNSLNADVLTTCDVTVTVSAQTIFTLTVTDASGMTAADDLVVRIVPLSANAGPDSNILLGGTATLVGSWSGASCPNGSCISCVWRNPDGSVLARTCTATASPPYTSQFTLNISDSGSGSAASDSATVYITNIPANLCGWNVVVLTSNEYPSAGNPNYICSPDGRARRQTVNGNPSIVLSDLVIENARIVGYIGVETSGDDDLIGFLWGFENPVHYYLLIWKQLNQNWTARCGNALAGIALKKVDGSTLTPAGITFNPSFGYNATDRINSCGLFWSTDRNNQALHPESPFLVSPRDVGAFIGGWRDFITYRFEIYYTPSRSKVRIYEDDLRNGSTAVLVREYTVVDSSYPRGRVAFFSNSQEQVDFGDFTFASLDGYLADAGPDQMLSAGQVATLSGIAELAVPPFNCSWSSGGTQVATTCTTTVSPVTDTSYTLTITDDFGRVTSDQMAIDVQP